MNIWRWLARQDEAIFKSGAKVGIFSFRKKAV
jgi:hypothetical protein